MTQEPKRRGRPPLPEGAIRSDKHPRSVRLSDEQWAKLQRLGREWLEDAIDRAREPLNSTHQSKQNKKAAEAACVTID
ncbi:hypothetical protein [Paraburkholderia sp. J10-1]|uniref:hypothetical protein n=1 Tax=Paraburkholderia sp. J10-1 TaxID=2805430 RepID=UPI002AB6B3B3|nr:hypothetical protein [Paraburkholderia sp. J10-1]